MNFASRPLTRAGVALLMLAPATLAQQQAEATANGGITLQLQGQNPKQALAAAKTGRSAAAFDITGYWVAVINEDWRWRMMTPPKGDFSSVPLNLEGRRVADLWDATKDEAVSQQCRVYGAPSLMRLPTRLHVTWADDNTLQIESDAGTQTRLLRFGEAPPAGQPSWQGSSVAAWEAEAGAKKNAGPTGPRDLKVITTNLRTGYLRRNGIPYSENALLTEYVDIFPKLANGDEWMVLTAIVDDPLYLTERYITSSNFKREPDGAKWHPTPCTVR